MRFGWLVALCLSRRADPSAARLADDLFGAAAVALLGCLVPRRRLFIIDMWLWLLLASAIGCRGGARTTVASGAGRSRPRWRSLLGYIALNLLITAAREAAVRGGHRRRAEPHVRVAAAGRVLAPRPRLARRRLLPPHPLRPARRRTCRRHALRADQSRRSAGPRGDPARSATLRKFLRWSILPHSRGRARALLGAGDDRRRALWRTGGRSRLCARRPGADGAPGCQGPAAHKRGMGSRGEHLVAADRGFATGGGAARAAGRAGLRRGARPARPAAGARRHRRDPARRQPAPLGFRCARARPRPSISTAGGRWCGSRPRARSAGTRRGRGRMVEPRPGRAVRTVLGQRGRRSATPAAPRGRSAGSIALAHRLRDKRRGKAQRQHRRALRPRQRLLRRLARPDDDLFVRRASPRRRSARGRRSARKIATAARPARLQTGPAAARDRLRLGQPRDRAAKRGAVVGLTLSDEQKAWADARSPTPARRPRSRSASGLSRDAPSSSTPSRRSRWSRRSASAGGPPISTASRATCKPGGRAALQFITSITDLFDAMRATPTSSRPTSSPAAC